VGEKVDAGSVLCRLYYTGEENLDEAADTVGRRVPDFRYAAGKRRELILEVVG